MKKFKILAALKEDINSPSIWVKDNDIATRTLAKVSNIQESKSVWVELQIIDGNFLKHYNSSSQRLNINDENCLVVNQWYRNKLGIRSKEKFDLSIEPNSSPIAFPFRQMQAALNHPDSSIRICADLAIVSVVLGVFGLLLGAISLLK